MAGLILLITFLVSVVFAIIHVANMSKCILPDDNTCQIDPSTGLQLYPYCPDEAAEVAEVAEVIVLYWIKMVIFLILDTKVML